MEQVSIIPPRLFPGDRIAIVAPASPFDPENLAIGEEFLRSLGFSSVLGRHLFARSGYLAGDDTARLEDLRWAFQDSDIQGVFCARGGYGTLRLIDRLNDLGIENNPKILLGFSDITALSLYLFKRYSLVTLSGPMPAGKQIITMKPEQTVHLVSLLCDPDYRGRVPGKGKVLVKGEAVGPLLGGNLTMMVHLAAAGILPSLAGAVVLVEDVNEPPYKIDRALTTLLLGGFLKGAAGVVAGQFIGVDDDVVEDLLLDRLSNLKVPLISGFPIGHGKVNVAVPIGGQVKLDAHEHGNLTLMQGAVC